MTGVGPSGPSNAEPPPPPLTRAWPPRLCGAGVGPSGPPRPDLGGGGPFGPTTSPREGPRPSPWPQPRRVRGHGEGGHTLNFVMIQHQSILKVADNSGAKTVKCIKILNKSGKYAFIGDCIIVSVRSLKSGSGSRPADAGSTTTAKRTSPPTKAAVGGKRSTTIQKGQIFKALVIRTKKGVTYKQRKCATYVAFEDNEVVLLAGPGQGNLVGSRIFGPITRELRTKNYRQVISQSKKLL